MNLGNPIKVQTTRKKVMKIKVGDEEVLLDSKNLEFDETNINDFLKSSASVFNYYNEMWCKAQYIQSMVDDKLTAICAEKFKNLKQSNIKISDKSAEAMVDADEQVVKAKKLLRDAKYVSQLLQTYLKSLDRAHANVLNYGYNLRKEMDKIFPQTIKGQSSFDNDVDSKVAKLFENE